MIYTIKSSPTGLSLPITAIDIIQNLPVHGKRIGTKIIVTKDELVEKINGFSVWWAKFWINIQVEKFEFEEKQQ